MQYGSIVGHALDGLALRGEGLYSLMKLAPMQCGPIIGARSR